MPAGGQSGALLAPQPVIRLVDALGQHRPDNRHRRHRGDRLRHRHAGGHPHGEYGERRRHFYGPFADRYGGEFHPQLQLRAAHQRHFGGDRADRRCARCPGFQVQPSSVASGASILSARAGPRRGRAGNLVGTATNSITISLASNPSGGVLGGTLTAAAVAGRRDVLDAHNRPGRHGVRIGCGGRGPDGRDQRRLQRHGRGRDATRVPDPAGDDDRGRRVVAGRPGRDSRCGGEPCHDRPPVR